MAKQGGAKGALRGKKRKLSREESSTPNERSFRRVRADEMNWRDLGDPDDNFFPDIEVLEDFGVNGDAGLDHQRATEVTGPDESDFEGFSDAGSPERPAKKEKKAAKKIDTEKETNKTNKTKKESKKESKKETKKGKKKEDQEESSSHAAPQSGKETTNTATDEELGAAADYAVLANVEDEEEMDMSAWTPLELGPQLLSCLAKCKFSRPTAIQSSSVPDILAGHDVIGKAPTGSGKTLAFALPIVQQWLDRENSRQGHKAASRRTRETPPIALVLAPTRELATQICSEIDKLCTALPDRPRVCRVVGGFAAVKQERLLAKADIVVATLGRLWDLMEEDATLQDALRSISFLVVDEADRLLADGNYKELDEVIRALQIGGDGQLAGTTPWQTLLFSATYKTSSDKQKGSKKGGSKADDGADDVKSVPDLVQRLNFRETSPVYIDVDPTAQLVRTLKERMVQFANEKDRDLYLYAMLLLVPSKRTIVFCNAINSAKRITPMLQNLGLPAMTIHSGMEQMQRQKVIEAFATSQNARGAILVASDVAARGLDIPNVDAVIHYHVPRNKETFVHRSGRTARSGRPGWSVVLCMAKEVQTMDRIAAEIHAAEAKEKGSRKASVLIRTMDVQPWLLARMDERLGMAKTLADSDLRKTSVDKEDRELRKMADALEISLDEARERVGGGKKAKKPAGWHPEDGEPRDPDILSKREMKAARFQLRQMLATTLDRGRIDTGAFVTADGDIGSRPLSAKVFYHDARSDFAGHVPRDGFSG